MKTITTVISSLMMIIAIGSATIANAANEKAETTNVEIVDFDYNNDNRINIADYVILKSAIVDSEKLANGESPTVEALILFQKYMFGLIELSENAPVTTSVTTTEPLSTMPTTTTDVTTLVTSVATLVTTPSTTTVTTTPVISVETTPIITTVTTIPVTTVTTTEAPKPEIIDLNALELSKIKIEDLQETMEIEVDAKAETIALKKNNIIYVSSYSYETLMSSPITFQGFINVKGEKFVAYSMNKSKTWLVVPFDSKYMFNSDELNYPSRTYDFKGLKRTSENDEFFETFMKSYFEGYTGKAGVIELYPGDSSFEWKTGESVTKLLIDGDGIKRNSDDTEFFEYLNHDKIKFIISASSMGYYIRWDLSEVTFS